MSDSRQEVVERLVKQGTEGLGKRLAHYAQGGDTRQERKLRWQAISVVLHRHHAKAKGLRRRKLFGRQWTWVHKQFLRIRRRLRRARRRRQEQQDGWPGDMHITELFNNDNGYHNHVHIASTDRDALIRLGKIAEAQYGGAGMVREFPPFDPVECVHVSTSWHYRDSSAPYVPRVCANRGDGCAMDLSFPRRQEFANEVKRRYGADVCDF